MEQISNVYMPKMVIRIENVGENSLIGALAVRLIESGHINNLGLINFEKLTFVIKNCNVDILTEIIKVRDLMKIHEDQITVIVG